MYGCMYLVTCVLCINVFIRVCNKYGLHIWTYAYVCLFGVVCITIEYYMYYVVLNLTIYIEHLSAQVSQKSS